ncbi:MAG TPA: Na+/H+ antiporter subunit D [Terriglobales bacterium]|nr:Na+/H+ antiporter subunit D [Terriglobales bacterium]
MERLLVLPILIPFLTAVTSLLAWRWRWLQRVLGLIGAVALLLASMGLLESVRLYGIQVVQMGSWPAPFGITFVADLFGAMMVLVAGIIGLAVTVYSLVSMDAQRESFGYYPLLNLLLMGVCGAFLTGDIFNLYVWFEVMLIASFVLLVLGGERAQMEGGIKYVTLNLLSSALFLAAVGILYGLTGSLNMADLARRLPGLPSQGLVTASAMLFFVAFGIKSAVFPLFFWLPASYHTPPVAVSAIFSGLLTKVGVYAMIRVFTLMFVQDVGYTHSLILVISGITMLVGVLGAVAQNEFRRILSFHIISQIGYMTMGLGLFTPLALAGSIFYIVHHIIVKTNLFLVSGVARRVCGTYELKHLGGLYRSEPALAVLFLIPAFSLAGVPPLSGFFAKLILLKAGLETKQYAIVAVALVVGLLTLFSMAKIWNEAFWKAQPHGEPGADKELVHEPENLSPLNKGLYFAPILWLAAITVAIGLRAELFFDLASQAGQQLANPDIYIRAVLGGR